MDTVLPLLAFYFLWILWFLAWFIATVGPVTGVRKLTLLEEILYRIVTLSATALLFTLTPFPGLDVQYRLWERAPTAMLSWRLVGVAAVALSFSWWALIHRITVLKAGHPLVTTGPYRLLRHPVYAGLIIAMAATAIQFGKPSSLMGAILFAIAFVLKAITEEQRTDLGVLQPYKARAMMFVPLLGLIGFYLRRFLPQKAAPVPSAPIFVSPQALAKQAVPKAPLVQTPARMPAPPAVVMSDRALGTDLGLAPSLRVTAVPIELVLDRQPKRDPAPT